MTMSNAKLACLVLSMLCVGVAAHRLLETSGRDLRDHNADAEEHQRILAELEAVHQLRERMLQQGTVIASSNPQACSTACSTLQLGIVTNTASLQMLPVSARVGNRQTPINAIFTTRWSMSLSCSRASCSMRMGRKYTADYCCTVLRCASSCATVDTDYRQGACMSGHGRV